MSPNFESLCAVARRRDAKLFADFVVQKGETELACTIRDAALNCTKDRVYIFYDIAWSIFVERQRSAFGEVPRFETTSELILFQELVYSLDAFLVLRVPYEDWEFLARELFSLLHELGAIPSSAILQFKEAVSLGKNKILGQKKYQENYIDYMNGAF